MALRKVLIVKGEFYHIFNRTVGSEEVFLKKREIERALNTIQFYAFENINVRYSYYNRLKPDIKDKFWKEVLKKPSHRLDIFSFSLMPNHFHFLARETKHKGIFSFISNFQNSFAKYYNTKYKRKGSLFQSNFKAVRIENEEQFKHVARYIHLNPLTSYIIKEKENLKTYPATSFPDYLGTRDLKIIKKEFLPKLFSSRKRMIEFTFNQLDYQRKLAKIKSLVLE